MNNEIATMRTNPDAHARDREPRQAPDMPRQAPDMPRQAPDMPRHAPDMPRQAPDMPRSPPPYPPTTRHTQHSRPCALKQAINYPEILMPTRTRNPKEPETVKDTKPTCSLQNATHVTLLLCSFKHMRSRAATALVSSPAILLQFALDASACLPAPRVPRLPRSRLAAPKHHLLLVVPSIQQAPILVK